jgi:GNAT superfamily N-acetyltransferase
MRSPASSSEQFSPATGTSSGPHSLSQPNSSLLAEWKEILGRARASVLIAEAHREVVGTIVVCYHEGCIGRVSRLHVDPPYSSRGIGELLVTSGLEYLRARGIERAELWVLQRNYRAPTAL